MAPPFVHEAPVTAPLPPPPGLAFGLKVPPTRTKSRGIADRIRADVQKATIWSCVETAGRAAPTGAATAGIAMSASAASRAGRERLGPRTSSGGWKGGRVP